MIRSFVLISALMVPAALLAQPPREVRDADNPAFQPFACSVPVSSTGFIGPGVVAAACAVPAHKRLVIENVNANIAIAYPILGLTVTVTTNGTARNFVYPAALAGPLSTPSPSAYWIASQSVRLYADPGSNVALVFNVGAGTGSPGPGEFAVFNLSGYLVNIP